MLYGRNLRLLCDLWRLAFEKTEAYTPKDGDFEGHLRAELREAIMAMSGLEEKQMLQTAVSSRNEWLALQRLPAIRAFICSSICFLSQRVTHSFQRWILERKNCATILLRTSFYTSGGKHTHTCPHVVRRISRKGIEGQKVYIAEIIINFLRSVFEERNIELGKIFRPYPKL